VPKEEEQKYKIENRKGIYNENIEHCEDNYFVIDKGALDRNRIQESMPVGRFSNCVTTMSLSLRVVTRM